MSELLYSPATYGIDLSSKDFIKPRARAAPMLCVLRNTLWMLGGQVEISHTDIVLGERLAGVAGLEGVPAGLHLLGCPACLYTSIRIWHTHREGETGRQAGLQLTCQALLGHVGPLLLAA